jgi:hypothetical protein
LPERADDAPPVIDSEMRARLNNTRALLQRQLRPDIAVDLVVMGRLLVEAAPAFCEAGLAEEFLAYAQGFRERLADSPDLARLQVAMGEALSALPDHQTEAGWMFQVTLRLERLDRATRAEACLAYGRYLTQVGQTEAAGELYSIALRDRCRRRIARRDAGGGAGVGRMRWCRKIGMKKPSGAGERRGRAAETQAATLSAGAARPEPCAPVSGDADRAEDTLRRALATADYGAARSAGQIRSQLAGAIQGALTRPGSVRSATNGELASAAGT